MGAILPITLPIFACIALGYGAVRQGLFAPADMRVLGKFVLNIGLPALLFSAVGRADVTAVLNPVYMGVYLGGAALTGALIWAATRAQGVGPARRAIAVMGAVSPNSGYIGHPMMLLAFPHLAGQVLAMNMLVENFVILPACFVMLELSRAGPETSALDSLRRALWGVLKRPMIIALLAGLAFSLTGLTLPAAAERFLGLIAGSTGALALVVIGGALVGLPTAGNRLLAGQIVLGKLIIQPAMTALCLLLLGWAVLPPDLLAALVLSAAVPMISIYAVLAQDYGHEGLAAISLLGAVVASFVTLSVLLAVLL